MTPARTQHTGRTAATRPTVKRPRRAVAGIDTRQMPAGVLGLGLMGHSIAACLLAAGHPVIGVTRDLSTQGTRRRILSLLREMHREALLREDPAKLMQRLSLSEDVRDFTGAAIVIESITEDIAAKRRAYRAVERVVSRKTILGSNTSAIPVSLLQRGALHPERFVGIHWDEPAHITRFMEIIAGAGTARIHANRVMKLAAAWGKEPSLVRRDVPGFITNRISYAMFREACHLVDAGIATVEDVDRSLRNDVGWWMPFAGPFRYMDLMGVQGYWRVMRKLLPDLSTNAKIPRIMHRVVASGGRGVANGRGFYQYTKAQAERWQELFVRFNYDVRRLAMKYPEDSGNRPGVRVGSARRARRS